MSKSSDSKKKLPGAQSWKWRMQKEDDLKTLTAPIDFFFRPDVQSLWITTWCSSDLRHRASQVTSGLHQTQQHPQQQQLFAGQKFSETPFMNASDMDDMLFECKNNAIYVLNTNYAYGEFGRLNLFGTSPLNNTYSEPRNGILGPTSSLRNAPPNYTNSNYSNNLSRSSAASLVNSNHIAEVPQISVTERTSSTTTASVSTRTIPKLFHYSPNEHSDHLLQNHISNPHQQHLHHLPPYESSQHEPSPFVKTSGVTSPAVVATAQTTTISSSSSKKSSNLKSAIIAKKTKFWKYLEEEKWKKSTSVGNLTTTNCERNSDGSCLMKNNGMLINNTSNHANNTISQSGNNNNISNSNNNNNNGGRNKSAGDSNNQKSSTELYKEAAELLGLSCTLCDNCRCLDCQSRYFECDDSDSYSELSFLGDYYDTYDIQLPNTRHCQDFNGSNNAAECRSLQSDNSSICSVNSNHSDSP